MSAASRVSNTPPRLRTSLAISIFDQAWLSAANLLLGVFLIKHSSKEEYGGYVFGYAVILFLVGVQNALVSTQMSVLAPSRGATEQGRFCAALAIGQFLIFVPIAVAIALVGLMLQIYGTHNGANLAYAVALAVLGIILREFFRSYFFLRLRPLAVLWLDVAFVTFLFAGLWAAVVMNIPSINLAALVVMGFVSALVGSLAAYLSRKELPVRLADIAPALKESWQHGKWALGGVSVTWLQDQSYIYLLTSFASAAETAEVSAARLFLAPLALLNAGFSRVLTPRWAYMAHEKKHQKLDLMARKVKWLLIGMVIMYVACLLLLKDRLVPLLLTGEYTQTSTLILMWGAIFAFQVVRGNYSSLLQVFKKFRDITLANTATALVVVAMGAALIPAYGAKGSMVTLMLGEAGLVALLIYGYRNARKNID